MFHQALSGIFSFFTLLTFLILVGSISEQGGIKMASASILVWRRRPDSAEGSGVSPIRSLVLRNAIFNDF